MTTYHRPTNRSPRGILSRTPLPLAFTLMMLLGSLVSLLSLPVAAAVPAVDMRIGQPVVDLDKQPVQPSSFELVKQTAATPTAEVNVTVHWCPPGTNPDTVQSGETIKPACTNQGPAVNVALIRADRENAGPVTRAISSFPGTAMYGNLEPGSYEILGHLMPYNRSGLFCTGSTPDGTTRPYARVVEMSAIEINAGETITCDWFGELTGPGTVALTTWNCAEGFDFATAGYEIAKQECAGPMTPEGSFTLTNDAAIPPYEARIAAGSEATEQNVPAGTVKVEQSAPQGYVMVAVVCSTTSTLDPAQSGTDQDVPLTGVNTFDLMVPADGSIMCDVFGAAGVPVPGTPMATPNVDGTSVTILNWECVPGTLTGQPMSYYQGDDQCEGEKLGVVFDVTDDTGTRQTTSERGGIRLDDLVGQVTIEEILPAEYETPAVFCTSLTSQPGQEITGSGNTVTLPPGADNDYECSFYNIPSGLSATGTGDVLVYTYACASAPPPNSTYAWYFQNCATRQNGATFVLDTPDVDIETNAGDSINGAVTMRGLKVGNYSLTETAMVPNHESGAVFCAEIGKADLPGPAQMMPQPLSGNTITAPVTADKLLYCQWYHVPTTSAYTAVRQTA